MKLRKTVCLILSALLTITAANAGLSASADTVSVSLHTQGGSQAMQVGLDDVFGIQFNALANFSAIDISCPSFSNNKGGFTMALCAWDTDYITTLDTVPVAEQRFMDFEDNASLHFSFDSQPAGIYIIKLFNGTDDKAGFWYVPDCPADGMRLVKNNSDLNSGVSCNIVFYKPGEKYLGSLPEFKINGSSSAPAENQIFVDSAIAENGVDPSSWSAVDGLGRTLSTSAQVGEKNDEKFVGCFYWLWHSFWSSVTAPLNIESILKMYPEAVNDYNHAAWYQQSTGVENFWDAPMYGYYSTVDEYVIRKQAELLADAGVDVIIFDTTNGTNTWKAGYETVFKVFRQARAEGVNTPKIAFMFNFTSAGDANTRTELQMVYDDIYYPQRYSDLWFYWEGKPLIMARKDSLDRSDSKQNDIYNFFTYRENEPTYFKTDISANYETWGWCSDYPQTRFRVGNGGIEEMTVSVAQNCWDGKLTAMNNPEGSQGRSYTYGDYSYSYKYKGKTVTVDKNTENAVNYGLNFQQQWDYAIENDPKFIFITGWNEWIAGRFESWQGVANAFPDECNDEGSRDIEPSDGALKDYYYYQMVENIRRFKGCNTQTKAASQNTIDINGDISQWDNAGVSYTHYAGSTRARDTDGYITCHYTSEAARNDFVAAKTAYDNDNVYFYVKTKDNISPCTDPAWMRLLIDTDATGISDNWEGFEYILNRNSPTADEATLERSTGGWNFEAVGGVKYTVNGNTMQVAIPRSMLGLGSGSSIPAFTFKWSDNMQNDGDIMDFYKYGDVAPGGRFTYSFASDITKKGDVTGDGAIDSADALAILQNTVGKKNFTDNQKNSGDINSDGKIGSDDALLVLQYSVGKIKAFPENKS